MSATTTRYEIVTVFNFPASHEGANTLLRVWAMQTAAAIQNSNGRLTGARVLVPGLGTVCQDQVSRLYPAIRFEAREALKRIDVLCTQTSPFIFLDVCAIIVRPDAIAELLDAADAQPILAFNHQTIEKHTAQFDFKFINSGVFCVSDPSKFTLDAVRNVQVTQWCPGEDDQLLSHNYFIAHKIKYTPDSLTSAGWNACGAFKIPAGVSTPSTLENVLSVLPLETGGAKANLVTHGLAAAEENGQPVRILNYWYNYKPWMYFCTVYEALCVHAHAAFSQLGDGPSPLETTITIASPDNKLVSTESAVTDSIPMGLGWEFAALPRQMQVAVLATPRQPLNCRSVLARLQFTRGGGFESRLKEIITQNGFQIPDEKETYPEYIHALRNVSFILAPGPESHRHYEAWAAGAVPVVEHSPQLETKYRGMPVVWTHSHYEDVTEPRLRERMARIQMEWRSKKYASRMGTVLNPGSYEVAERSLIARELIQNIDKISGGAVKVGVKIDTNELDFTTTKDVVKTTVFCAVWSGDPLRWQLLKNHQACLDRQTRSIERVYVFDGGDLPPKWLKGTHLITSKTLTVYEAWAEAIKAVKTPYVMNLNLDDRLCPDAVQIVECVLDTGGDMVGGEWRVEFSQEATDAACADDTFGPLPPFSPEWPPSSDKGVLRLGSGTDERGTFGPGTAWRVSLHEKLGEYPTTFLNGERIRSIGDTTWWHLAFAANMKCMKIAKIIGRYYSHPSDQAEFRVNVENEKDWMIELVARRIAELIASGVLPPTALADFANRCAEASAKRVRADVLPASSS